MMIYRCYLFSCVFLISLRNYTQACFTDDFFFGDLFWSKCIVKLVLNKNEPSNIVISEIDWQYMFLTQTIVLTG